jgi:hypothetical protein
MVVRVKRDDFNVEGDPGVAVKVTAGSSWTRVAIEGLEGRTQ